MPGPVAPVPCPECGGPMWDNSRDPKKKPNASDYRCKDRQNCNGGIWLKPEERAALGAPPARAQGGRQAPAQPAAPAAPRRRLILEKVLKNSILAVRAIEAEIVAEGGKEFGEGEEQKYACSLMIARLDDKGILQVEKAALDAREKRAAELAAKQAQERALAAQREAEEAAERARQASESQTGKPKHDFSDFPPALEDQDDDLPF